jgi:hypothetical protein
MPLLSSLPSLTVDKASDSGASIPEYAFGDNAGCVAGRRHGGIHAEKGSENDFYSSSSMSLVQQWVSAYPGSGLPVAPG